MNAVFRVDASSRIGGGHLMRCLALAGALAARGVSSRFVCREPAREFFETLAQPDVAFTMLRGPEVSEQSQSRGDASRTGEIIGTTKPDWLVLDHYALGIEWERSLRPRVARLLVIDDFPGRPHECDALLDQNLSADATQRYAGLVPKSCERMLGPKYALLRREFRAARENLAPRSGELRHILVFLTSGDDQGETLKAMQGIELLGADLRVDVVVGAANPHAAEIARRCGTLGWQCHRQAGNMAELMARADLAIGAGGSSSWERCALGLPALVTVLADNQVLITRALEKAGAAIDVGWSRETTPETYLRALRGLGAQRLKAMSDVALRLVDGQGAERVTDYLVSAGKRVAGMAH